MNYESPAQILDEIAELTPIKSPEGMVFMTFHFKEAAANLLTISALDPVAKIPECKICAVKVEPYQVS